MAAGAGHRRKIAGIWGLPQMSTGDMRNVSIGMGESVEEIFPSASVPGGRNVAGGVDAEDP